ncbi:stathmin domain-containing protein 1 [Alosa pseudoharengus]|uniref:stathmin domain-containing protein 1 n=1 Tax=Alosa pseudoharengus TaxID=34774 RepID=UPI003F89BE31
MGCGASSNITLVEPVKPSSENEHDLLEVQRTEGGDRGDSAVSKHTTDSGLGLEAAEGIILPGAVPRQLPPLRASSLGQAQNNTPSPRQESSEILEQLLNQGIIPAQPHTASNGEAYSIIMDDAEKPLRRPPPRLEKLMVRKEEQGTATKEDIEEKMRQAEERRQTKEDELKVRLRTKSARHRQAASQLEADQTVVEELQLDAPSTRHSPPKTPDHQNPISPLEGRLESGGEEKEERGRDGVIVGDKDGGRGDAPLTDSLNMENDSTFQQVEDIEEIF